MKCARCAFAVRNAQDGVIYDNWSYMLRERGDPVDLCPTCTSRAIQPLAEDVPTSR